MTFTGTFFTIFARNMNWKSRYEYTILQINNELLKHLIEVACVFDSPFVNPR